MKLLAMIIFLSCSAYGKVFEVKENRVHFVNEQYKVSDFLKEYAIFKSLNVVLPQEFQDATMTLAGPRTMDVKTLDLYLSLALYQTGSAMFMLPETHTIKVIAARETRFRTATTYTDLSKVPETYENIIFSYRLKHISAANLARNLRVFASRYGRIIDHTGDGILVSDTAKNVRSLMEVVVALDTPEEAKNYTELQALNEKNKKILTKTRGLLEILGDHNIIFISLFALIGLIVGFGVRGYMMKRIEGGW